MPRPTQIFIIDYGSQYTHLIANRIRRLGVFTEIVTPAVKPIQLKNARGIILSGSPFSVYQTGAPHLDPQILDLKIPVLGICYGWQLMAYLLGGTVAKGRVREYGQANLSLKKTNPLFTNWNQSETVWMSHGDEVKALPPGFVLSASTTDCTYAAAYNSKKNMYGLQFHPEVTHTPHGQIIYHNFIFNICHCTKDWNLTDFLKAKIEEIQTAAQGKKIFLLVSGGVDSTVVFALLNQALGEKRVFGLHIDSGLMRYQETSGIKRALNKAGFHNLHITRAAPLFLKNLHRVYDPEEKRLIIGRTFLEVQKQVAQKLNLNPQEWLLAQGTIYPDTIEAGGTKHAAKIKTHHNRIPEIQTLIAKKQLIEPLRELYKDEVRALGVSLKLPSSLIMRQPFPGPGLAIRLLCSPTTIAVHQPLSLLQQITTFTKLSHYQAQVLPLKSVGVQGDERTYAHAVALKGSLNWAILTKLSTGITNRFREINRVLIFLGGKCDLDDLKLKRGYLTPKRLRLLRYVDYQTNKILKAHRLDEKIWQCPIILVPLHFSNGETVILRPVISAEAMTANFAQIPVKVAQEISTKLLKIPGIDAVLYDLTNKPPGTIEWE